jgi:tetratricopeptide (TPR) repeat protein
LLAEAHNRLARLRAQAGDRVGPVTHLRQAIDLWARLARAKPGESRYRFNLGVSHENLGDFYWTTDRLDATPHYRRAVAVYAELIAAAPQDVAYRKSRSDCLLYLSAIFRQRGKLDEARGALALAVEDLKVARARAPQDDSLVASLGRAHYRLADVLLEMGDHAAAARAAAEVPRVIPRAWKPCLDAAKLVARCADAARNDRALSVTERQRQAQRYTEQARDLLDVAASRGGDAPDALDDLIWTLSGKGGRPLLDRNRSIALARRLTGLHPKSPDAWYNLGVMLHKADRWGEAVPALQKSMALRKGGDAYDWFYVAMVRHKLGNQSGARQAYRRGVEWLATHKSEAELEGLRAEAAELLGVRDVFEEYLRRDGRRPRASGIDLFSLSAER